jgi:hypothetical protein
VGVLRSDQGSTSDLLLAAELAGDVTVISAELVDALLSILRRGDKPILDGAIRPEDGSIFEKGREIWPNLRVDGWAVFDVPKGATGLKLLVKGVPSSKGKLIDLENR